MYINSIKLNNVFSQNKSKNNALRNSKCEFCSENPEKAQTVFKNSSFDRVSFGQNKLTENEKQIILSAKKDFFKYSPSLATKTAVQAMGKQLISPAKMVVFFNILKNNNTLIEEFEALNVDDFVDFLKVFNSFESNVSKADFQTIKKAFWNYKDNISKNDSRELKDFLTIIRNHRAVGRFNDKYLQDILDTQILFNAYKNYLVPNANIKDLYFDMMQLNKNNFNNVPKINFIEYLKFKNLGFKSTTALMLQENFLKYRKDYPNATPALYIEYIKKNNNFVNAKSASGLSWFNQKLYGATRKKDIFLITDNNFSIANKILNGELIGEMLIARKKTKLDDKFDYIKFQDNKIVLAPKSKQSLRIRDLVDVANLLLPNAELKTAYITKYTPLESQIATDFEKHSRRAGFDENDYYDNLLNFNGEKINFHDFYLKNKKTILDVIKVIIKTHPKENFTIHGVLRAIERNLIYENITIDDLEKYANSEYTENIKHLLAGVLLLKRKLEKNLVLPNGEIVKGFTLEKEATLENDTLALGVYTQKINPHTGKNEILTYLFNKDYSLRTIIINDAFREEKYLYDFDKLVLSKNMKVPNRVIKINIE